MLLRWIVVLFLIFISRLSFGQDTIYYNYYWEVTVPDSAVFYSTADEDTIRNGRLIYYYLNGNIYEEKFFKNGKKVGLYSQYYPNNQKAMVGVYDDNVLKRLVAWNRSGETLLKEGSGKDISYHFNGSVKEMMDVANGLPSGERKVWHDNGRLAEVGTYFHHGNYRIRSAWDRNGVPMVVNGNGYYELLYPNGKIMRKGEYASGFQVGEWTNYYSNGKRKSVEHYYNGVLDGKVKYYHQNGRLEATGSYTMGLRSGAWTWYNRFGEELRTDLY